MNARTASETLATLNAYAAEGNRETYAPGAFDALRMVLGVVANLESHAQYGDRRAGVLAQLFLTAIAAELPEETR